MRVSTYGEGPILAKRIVCLRTLADETRLRIFRLLAVFPEHLWVCEIVDALGVP